MSAPQQYLFGDFRLDPVQRALFRKQELVSLTPKAIETLLFLVERHGRIVDKKELMEAVWPDTFVEEVSLARNVSVLRKILSESEDGQSFIETVPKRGYRFVARIQMYPDAGEDKTNASSSTGAKVDTRRSPWLRWAALVFIPLLAIGAIWYWRRDADRSAMASPRIMLAVLPVQNLSGDSSREYVSDGLTEEMIAQLGGMDPQHLGVIARTSSMAYKNSSKTIEQIGRELRVDYIVEASLRLSGDHVRVTAQLVRTNDQTHLWAKDYDYTARDIVAVQDEVSRAVAAQTHLKLSPEANQRLAQGRAQSPESYDLYLQGRYFWNQRSKESLHKALEHFYQATEKDPSNAKAFAGIADSLNMELFYGYSPGAGTILKAKEAAQKAIELNDSLAEGHAAMAYIEFMWLWEWPAAESEFRRAIELDRNYVSAHHWYALYLSAMARHAQATEEIQQAEGLDPLSPIIRAASGLTHYYGREYDGAIAESKVALEASPDFIPAHTVLGRAYEQKRMYAEAASEFDKAFALTGNKVPSYVAELGHLEAVSGKRAEALKALQSLQELQRQLPYVGFTAEALIYQGLGDREKAIQYLQKASDQNDPMVLWVRVDPRWESVLSDPRILALFPEKGSAHTR